MADPNARVQSYVDRCVADGTELGLQVVAYVDGQKKVDVVAGVADETTGRPVDPETLFVVFSATKGVVATAIHMLAERGKLDYDAPVSHYWPEFGQHGKEAITLRQVLSHQAGVPQQPPGWGPELAGDWDAVTAAVAALQPEWPAGSRTVYHGMTFGWIAGEVLRRVDGRDVRRFVHDEIGSRLGVSDLNVGVEPSDEPRVARLKPAAGQSTSLPTDAWNTSAMRRAIVPAAGGCFNARSLGALYNALATGGAPLLSPERVRLASERHTPQAHAEPIEMIFGLGYRLGGTVFSEGSILRAMSRRTSVFGHTGAGGSLGFADPENRFAFAVTKNLLRGPSKSGPHPTEALVSEVRAALNLPA